jgi:hypothetical protein
VESTAPLYDGIGRLYARHRRPDPRIAALIERALGDARTIVDVGAGAGSYEPADKAVVAVEPAVVMAAQRAVDAAPVVRAVAERIPFADDASDAALETVLTFDAVVHFDFWLFDYVPEARVLASYQELPPDAVAGIVGARSVEPVMIPFDCVDGFNWAFWRRPEQYLDRHGRHRRRRAPGRRAVRGPVPVRSRTGRCGRMSTPATKGAGAWVSLTSI